MIKVDTSVTINAPIDFVWNALTHHEGMVKWPDFHSVKILKKGTPHPDGLGCIRKVEAKGLKVTESITKFDAPHQMDYLVSEINHPIIHKGGTISLTETSDGIVVSWTSKFEMKSKNPIIKFIGGKLLVAQGTKGFKKALDWVKKDIESKVISNVS